MLWLIYAFSAALLSPFQAGLVYALSYFGFTQTRIAMGSMGASLMSSTAIANGGAVATGSIVAYLQGLGATAVYPSIVSTTSDLGIYATAVYAYVRRFFLN